MSFQIQFEEDFASFLQILFPSASQAFTLHVLLFINILHNISLTHPM